MNPPLSAAQHRAVTVGDVKLALSTLKNKRAAHICKITSEILKSACKLFFCISAHWVILLQFVTLLL